MSNQELIKVIGGKTSTVSGTLLNSISKLILTILDLGRAIGSAIKYSKSNLTCTK